MKVVSMVKFASFRFNQITVLWLKDGETGNHTVDGIWILNNYKRMPFIEAISNN